MATCLKAQNGALFPVSALTRCAVLPGKYQFRFGLSGIDRGWAVFDAGREYERRVRARITTVAQVPDQTVVLIPSDDGRWLWTTVVQTEEPLQRFDLLEIDDGGYDDEWPEAPEASTPEETAARFGNLELD